MIQYVSGATNNINAKTITLTWPLTYSETAVCWCIQGGNSGVNCGAQVCWNTLTDCSVKSAVGWFMTKVFGIGI